MDLNCRTCGEPFDHDELHEMGVPYEEAMDAFTKYGCGAVDHFWSGKPLQNCPNANTENGAMAAAIYEAADGDIDATISMLQDNMR